MGFYSWKCSISGESVASITSGRPIEQSRCYLVTPEETIYEPRYEGLCEFGGQDVFELLGDGNREKGIDDYCEGEPKFEIKVVLKKHFNNQTYAELAASEICEYQGHFFVD